MNVVLAIVIAASLLAWLCAPGMERAQHELDYPRPLKVMMAVKFGESLGWWQWSDVFGMKTDHYAMQPPHHEETAVLALAELLAQEHVGEIRQKTKVEEILGA